MSDFGFDTSILGWNLRKQPDQQTPTQYQQSLASLANSQLQNQAGQANLDQTLYNQQRQRTLADLVSQSSSSYSDPYAHALAQGGYGDEAMAAQQRGDQLMKLHGDILASRLASIPNQEQWAKVRASLPDSTIAQYEIPENFDPQWMKAFRDSRLTPEQQTTQQWHQGMVDEKNAAIGRDKTIVGKDGAIYRFNPLTQDFERLAGPTVAPKTRGAAPVSGQTQATTTGADGTPIEATAPPGSKMATYKEKLLSKLGEDLDPTKGVRNLPTKAQAQIAAGERLEQLLDAGGPFTAQRLHEATMMAATIANGGNQPTESMVESMFPSTFKGRSAEFWQSLANVPMDVDANAFVDQLRNQSKRETELGKKQIQQYFLNRLSKHPQAFQDFPIEAGRMAEAAGLKDLYDSKTLLPLKASGDSGAPGGGKPNIRARLMQLRSSGAAPADIRAALSKEYTPDEIKAAASANK